QGYVFAGKRHAAALALALGEVATAARLDAEAERLRQQFEAAFWCEDLSTYALALDGSKRPCRVIASNAGHALLTGIAAPDRAARGADTLLRVGSVFRWGNRPRGDRPARPGGAGRRHAVAGRLVFRLGHPHRGDVCGPL